MLTLISKVAAAGIMLGAVLFNQTTSAVAAEDIKFVVPSTPGGPIDGIARALAQAMQQQSGKVIIVDNRPGAAGLLGSEFVVRSEPDGKTFLITSGGHTTNPALYPEIPYDTVKDFTPLTMIGRTSGFILVGNPKVPADTLEALIAYAKEAPGKLTYASAGNGNTTHIVAEMFKKGAGVDLLHIPYKGGAPALTDVVGGQVDLTFATELQVGPYLKAGTLKAFASTGEKHSKNFPDIPLLSEKGIKGVNVPAWVGIFGPAKMQDSVIDTAYSEVVAAVKSPEFGAQLAKLGWEPVGSDRTEFTKFVADEVGRYKQVIGELGIKAD